MSTVTNSNDETSQTPPIKVKRVISWRVTLWLLIIWLILFQDVSLVVILGGLLVGVAIQFVFPMPHLGVFSNIRPIPLVILVARFIYDIFVSALRVAYLVVRHKDVASYTVNVPMRIQSELYTTLVGDMCSLTPGTLVIGARMYPAMIELHVFDSRSFGKREHIIEETQALEARVVRAIGTKEECQIIDRAVAADKRRRQRRDQIMATRQATTPQATHDDFGDDRR